MKDTNVLVIEEKKEDAALLEEILVAAGYKVWCCFSGEDAIRIAKATPFNVVLTGLHTEGMSGQDVTREILKINPSTGVIVMTSPVFIEAAVEVMETGAYGYITKPIHPPEVRIVVRRSIERFELMEASRKKGVFAEMSVKDGLTDVYNRRFLDVFMRQKYQKLDIKTAKFSVLMIDIDYFKKYNDAHGHCAGDELLQEAAKIFQQAVRRDDVVFRYGGEEFLVYLDRCDRNISYQIAERIRNEISICVPVTVSIGIGVFPEDGETADALIKVADASLYKAKEGGRNQICMKK